MAFNTSAQVWCLSDARARGVKLVENVSQRSEGEGGCSATSNSHPDDNFGDKFERSAKIRLYHIDAAESLF